MSRLDIIASRPTDGFFSFAIEKYRSGDNLRQLNHPRRRTIHQKLQPASDRTGAQDKDPLG